MKKKRTLIKRTLRKRTLRKTNVKKHIGMQYKRFRKHSFRKQTNSTRKISRGGVLSPLTYIKSRLSRKAGPEKAAAEAETIVSPARPNDPVAVVETKRETDDDIITKWVNNLIPNISQQNNRDKMIKILRDALDLESTTIEIIDKATSGTPEHQILNDSLIKLITHKYEEDDIFVNVIAIKLENAVANGDMGHKIASFSGSNNHTRQKNDLMKKHKQVNETIFSLKNKEDKSVLNNEWIEYLNAINEFNTVEGEALSMLGITLDDIKNMKSQRLAILAPVIRYYEDQSSTVHGLSEVLHTGPIYTTMTEELFSGVLDINEIVVRKDIIDCITPTIIDVQYASTVQSMLDDIIKYLKHQISFIISHIIIHKYSHHQYFVLQQYTEELRSELRQRMRSNSWTIEIKEVKSQ